MVQFNAHFDGHVITPDESVDLPVNTPLRVTIETTTGHAETGVDWQRILDIAAECAIEGPEDLSRNHDFYAHGKPIE